MSPLRWLPKVFTNTKFLAPRPNHFGTALPIYTTQNKRFFSSWTRFQFLIGTSFLHLFYSRKMVDIQLAIILHRILRVKCDLNLNRKSHLRFNKEIDRHLGGIRKKDGRRNGCLQRWRTWLVRTPVKDAYGWDRVITPGLTWQTRSLFGRHFCYNHACVMVKLTTKKAWKVTGELSDERNLWHGVSFTRAETTSGRWSRHP